MGIPCGRSEGRTREAYNVMACQDGILYIENEGGTGRCRGGDAESKAKRKKI